MKPLETLLAHRRTIRVMGFDDAPFEKRPGAPVDVAGVVCADTRFEGMVWGTATRDGDDATRVMAALLTGSKFAEQVHLVLIDGLAVGGFNLVDLPALAEAVGRPCVAVMRKRPDMAAIRRALARFDDVERRLALIARAGPVHAYGPFVFQVAGASPEVIGPTLNRLTDRGHVPEALRVAHLIGSAVRTGESGRRA